MVAAFTGIGNDVGGFRLSGLRACLRHLRRRTCFCLRGM